MGGRGAGVLPVTANSQMCVAALTAKCAKQRNEIARLTQALEKCAAEKRALAMELRAARDGK